MKDVFDLLWEYRTMFDENFPTFMFMGVPEQKVMNIIEKSIKNNTPYRVEHDEDKVY